ncbi:nucleotide sugar dehydrogenase [Halohasta salina]|uniref:nucleotide sugar dehydrogenase n=1 Tax=Halohasta salina TaxID=2961621 RepID=UPI0020A482CF|nr:nucleotide sugar dehydrogenase [Halohasta salina]
MSDLGLYNSDREESAQREALLGGEVPVAVYGLGKMGLPLAGVYADLTGNVVGADVDPAVVQSVNDGACHVDGEPGLAELVDRTVESGALRAVDDPTAAATEARLHVVIVPTLIDDGRADLTVVESVIEDIAAGLQPGDLIVIESTVPPRTCEDVVVPRLASDSGLPAEEFGVAFCPERTESGRALRDIRGSWPKVVGGVDSESTRAAALVYDQVTDNDVIAASDATTAEAVKVFEGAYRDVNIALANELATYTDALGIDVREAIAVANTVDESDILRPGPGVGGHCIPYYPYFLFGEFDVDSPLLRTAREVNDEMPAVVVGKLASLLADRGRSLDDASILVLGGTYRAGVAETRASPAIGITETLSANGAAVDIVDPMLDSFDEFNATPVSLADIDADYDGIVLVTAHEAFEAIDWATFDDPIVVDTRAVLDPETVDHEVYTIGGRGGVDIATRIRGGPAASGPADAAATDGGGE